MNHENTTDHAFSEMDRESKNSLILCMGRIAYGLSVLVYRARYFIKVLRR